MHPHQRFLLRAKHWEIFSLWLACRIIGALAVHVATIGTPKPQLTPPLDLVLKVLASVDTLVVWAWCYVVGTFLGSISPKHLRLRPGIFFLAVISLSSLGVFWMFWKLEAGWATLLIISLAFLCFVYTIRFAAKSLMVAEYQEPAQFPAYFAYLLAVSVFPIGIWFLQPLVNELFATNENAPTPATSVQSPGLIA